MQASWWFCLTSSLLLGLEEVIDLTVSKYGTQGSLKLSVSHCYRAEAATPQPLQETPQAGQVDVGPASPFRIRPSYNEQL